MKASRIIRGKPIYKFRGRQYVYQPEKTSIRKMRYDEKTNTTYVFCYKPTLIPEVFLIGIMISLALLNVLWIHKRSEIVYYNEYTIYHNGNLYINLTSDSNNVYELSYYLSDSGGNEVAGGTLQPGACSLVVPITNPDKEYILNIKYKTLITERAVPLKLIVVNKDGKSEEFEQDG